MANFTINELKQHLGPGLGLRKNRYMLEMPVPGINGETMNILCQSAGLPERNIQTTELWHKGRKYIINGETDYVNEYEISIIDDSEMKIREMFDKWLKIIDNSRLSTDNSYASYETLGNRIAKPINEISNSISQLANTVNSTKTKIRNATGSIEGAIDFFLGNGFNLDVNGASVQNYQVDINIWQMDRKQNKVYGYKLEKAFPKSIGVISLEDSEENSLSEFTVSFAFSEFTPIRNNNYESITNEFGSVINDLKSIF